MAVSTEAAAATPEETLKAFKLQIAVDLPENLQTSDDDLAFSREESQEHVITAFYKVVLPEAVGHDHLFRICSPQVNAPHEVAEILGTFKFSDMMQFNSHCYDLTFSPAEDVLRMPSGEKVQSPSCTLMSITAEMEGDTVQIREDFDEEDHSWRIVSRSSCTLVAQVIFSRPLTVDSIKRIVKVPAKDLALKASLLEKAHQSGDLNLIGKGGIKVPAHSAVLVSIPYFEAKLKEEWSEPVWNLNKKLDLQLPCPVSDEVIHAFLKYVYGDVWSISQRNSSTDPAVFQDLFSLGDACGVPTLCAAIGEQLIVTAASASSWLGWLAKEHGYRVKPIQDKVTKVVNNKFTSPDLWEGLTVEQLQILETVAEKIKPTKV